VRKVVVTEFIALDGVTEDPGGAEQSTYGGWTGQHFSDDVGKFKQDELFASDALLLGRVTYQGFAAAWPSQTDEAGFADRMNSLPKYVVSTSLDTVDWNHSHLVHGNVADEVARLKEQPGQDILVYGSGTLVESLQQHGLIDEIRLMIFPVVVGGASASTRTGQIEP
jgi:dihydrofolate reductase